MTRYKYHHNLHHFTYLCSTNANHLETGCEGAWGQAILTADASSKAGLSRRPKRIKRREEEHKIRKF